MRFAFRLHGLLRDGVVGRATFKSLLPLPSVASCLTENPIHRALRIATTTTRRSTTTRSFSSADAGKNAADDVGVPVSVAASAVAQTADGNGGGSSSSDREMDTRSAMVSSRSSSDRRTAYAPQSRTRSGSSRRRSGSLSPFEELSEAEQRLLKVLQCEFDALVAAGAKMPDHVTDEDWVRIVRERLTKSSRMRHYNYLAARERHVQGRLRQKEERRRISKETEQEQLEAKELVPGTSYYVMPHNTIFHRIYPRVIKRLDDMRVAYAMQFGQPLVVDVGFGRDMSDKEHSALNTELLFLIGLNRSMREPFHLCLCNMNFDDLSMRVFEKHILASPSYRRSDDDETDAASAADDDVPGSLPVAAPPADGRKGWWADHYLMTTTKQCFTELFPREKLVYLTPHASEVMKSFDTDAIYILGGLVDLGPQGPLSLAKAKRLGIRTMKLPLDYFVKWKLGRKSLGINHVFGMLKEVKENGGDWRRAIELHVPSRKVDIATEVEVAAASELLARERPSVRAVAGDQSRRKFPRAEADRLAFHRTYDGKQYGHLDGRSVAATYKHYKKPRSS